MTKAIITEMNEMQCEYIEMIWQNAFVNGFKSGAQVDARYCILNRPQNGIRKDSSYREANLFLFFA